MMKICAMPACGKDSVRNPDLMFFPLPRDPSVRDEWLELLEIKRNDATSQLRVCETHFRAKDLASSKKQLKPHAVPVYKLGAGKSDVVNSDDEFMQCDSDSEPEIIEIKSVNKSTINSSNDSEKSKEVKEITVKQEINDYKEDCDLGRRPSRRAARLAAKKIYNTVRNYGVGAEDGDTEGEEELKVPASPKSAVTNKPYPRFDKIQRFRQKYKDYQKILPANIDLIMECHEELLSAVQAEALLKAQLDYNTVMKTLRTLKANNVRIVVSPLPEDPEPEKHETLILPKPPVPIAPKPETETNISKIITVTPIGITNVTSSELSSTIHSPISPTI